MANLAGKYDPNAEAQQDLGKLPTGEYLAQIIDSDVKPTNNNTGEFAEFVYEVMDGPLKGRKHWQRITLDNPNAKAVEIGNRQLASLREATGIIAPRDTQDFHYKPHVIRIEFQPAGSLYTSGQKKGQPRQYDEAEIKAWKKPSGDVGNAQAAASAADATCASPSSGGAAPWNRRNAA